MTRWVEQIEGLSLAGEGSLGAGRLRVPLVLEARRPGEPAPAAPGVGLAERDGAPPGRRYLRIETSPPVDLDLPVGSAEITGGTPGFERVGSRVALIHGPTTPEALDEIARERPELVILGNARQLFSEGEPFVRALRSIHTALRGSALLWTPRVGLPHRIPLLVYLGVDLLDTTEGRLGSLAGTVWDESLGAEDAPNDRSSRPVETVGPEYGRALAKTRTAIARGRLRELVESRLTAEPALAEMLRYADRLLGDLLEERVSVVGTGRIGRYVLAESIRRPEMRRFRDRLVERYRPPPSKEVLLLVPCSRTKPYRLSRTHRRFARSWEGFGRVERLHVVSVSSPIGLVPRELEDVYPARHYDIPVTGDWTAAEQAIVQLGVKHLLREGRYHSVIVHLDPGEYGFLRDSLRPDRPTVWTLGDDRTTSEEAISALRTAIGESLAEIGPVPGGPLAVVREELQEIASWQFGRSVATALFRPPIRLLGRPWFQRLSDGSGTELASWREERGLFHLTRAGAARVLDAGAPTVDADPKVPLTGDLFVPGVLRSDPGLRIGDSVIVRKDGAFAAIGEAALPGPLMTTLGHGLAVRIRHRAGPSTDTAMTGKGTGPAGPVV